ncbi:MAG: HAD family hydrolase [Dermabacter sp.]|nr:HAD family hydrolase [Dermabacter sp.]
MNALICRTPGLIATDYDGTLADSGGQIPAPVTDAFARARDAGLALLIVTARPPRWLTHLAPLVGEDAIIVAGNGAFEYAPATGSVRVTGGFTPAETLAIVERLREIPGIALSAERASGPWRDAHYPVSELPMASGWVRGPRVGADEVVAPLEELPDTAGKILARSSTLSADEFRARVRILVGDRASLHISTDDALAELSPPTLSKATALARIAHARGIPRHSVWAVGDMPNDAPMLAWSALGIAVRNAHPILHAGAQAIAPTNDEAGVAHVIDAALRARRGIG